MAQLEYKGRKQHLLETVQLMNRMLMEFAVEFQKRGGDFGEVQERRLVAEARLKFGLPTEVVQQSIDDLIATERLSRGKQKPIPAPPPLTPEEMKFLKTKED